MRCAPCGRLGFATFSPPLRYGENVAYAGNVERASKGILMKELPEIKSKIKQFIDTYNFSEKIRTWKNHSDKFHEIWKNYILPGDAETGNFDELVFMIDSNARGSTKSDEAVARTYIRYSTWYRMFGDLNENKSLKEIMNNIFNTVDENDLISLINKLFEENKNNKNGLTGNSGVILNAMLFINNPQYFISSVSLRHRIDIIEYFTLPQIDNFDNLSYGEKIIQTNSIILINFKNIFDETNLDIDPFIQPRLISDFIYSNEVKENIWPKNDKSDENETNDDEPNLEQQRFHLEKYLEHFLYTNWENTQLGEKYEIIEEDGEPVSLQYRTDIGNIDLLVKDKKTGDYLVIELKRGQTSDDTIGQITRYMGWVKENLAKNKKVKGIIIAGNYDKKIKYSLEMVKDIELFVYNISFSLEKHKT
jgi:hypothetical protein